MLLALVLAACFAPAAHEWVEISQTHYRKPLRTHDGTEQIFFPAHEETTNKDVQHTFFPADRETIDNERHNFPGNDKSTSEKKRLAFPIREKVTETNVRKTFFPVDEETSSENMRHTLFPYEETVNNGIRHSSRPLTTKPSYFSEDNVDLLYPNRSITEHKWNQNDYRSNIKRVNADVKMKANVTPEFTLDVFGEVTEREPELVTKPKDKQVVSATIERVSSKGSVKRVTLSNTPVKSPSLSNSVRRNDIKRHGPSVTNSDLSDEFEIKADNILKDLQNDAVTQTNQAKGVISSTKATPNWKYTWRTTSTSWPSTESTLTFHKYTQKPFENNKTPNNVARNKANSSKITQYTNRGEDNSVAVSNIKTNNLHKRPLQEVEGSEKIFEVAPNFVTKNNNINIPEDTPKEEVNESPDSKINLVNRNNTGDTGVQYPKGHRTQSNGDEHPKRNEKVNERINENALETLMRFLKVVTDTISKSSRQGVNGKVKYLQELKDTLLRSIEDRIEATWPDEGGSGSRRARSTHAHQARGHVEFPSSESSLMTISFLTFAVFLIKLVLQVIQTYKHKAMVMAPLVVATAGRKLRKMRDFH